MLDSFNPLDTSFTLYVVLNWILALACSAIFLRIYLYERYLFLKPSMILLAMSNLLFQLPLAVYSGYYEHWLPHPYGLVLLVHGFVIGGLAGSYFSFRSASRVLWQRLNEGAAAQYTLVIAIGLLFVAGIGLGAAYLANVPFHCTGFYAAMVNPDAYTLAREISLKLLADPVPRYAMSLIMAAVAPLLTAATAYLFITARPWFTVRNVVIVVMLLLIWGLASLNGGRANLAYLGLVIIATLLWQARLKVSPIKLPVMVLVALAPAYILTFLTVASPFKGTEHDISVCFNEVRLTTIPEAQALEHTFDIASVTPPSAQSALDKILNAVSVRASKNAPPSHAVAKPDESWLAKATDHVLYALRTANSHVRLAFAIAWTSVLYYTDLMAKQILSILFRAVVVPFEVGGWFVHYLQTKGPIGIAGIVRLAPLFGREPVSAGNVIALTYGPEYYGHPVVPTMNAGAGFLFSYFAYFGYTAIALNLVLLWLLDVALLVFLRVDKALLIPVLAATSLATLKFIEADYSAAWLTHGFGPILLLGIALTYAIPLLRRATRTADA